MGCHTVGASNAPPPNKIAHALRGIDGFARLSGTVRTSNIRACPVCGALLPDGSESCPVCALRGALEPEGGPFSEGHASSDSEFRFEHYQVLKNEDGTPVELGHGAMGVTYKAFDVRLQRPAALKIINSKLIGNESARLRFIREARAAASVRHQNVASVFHIGKSDGNYYYAMEFVEGESLEKLIRPSGSLETDLALEIVAQVAAGLAAIEEQHLVHRDIKPSNIMVSFQDGKLKSAKIIDLGLAKGVAEENTFSSVGAFVGTPAYASPEQFAGIATDIRSDLYSLGVTLWEMLSGKVPFSGSAAELMYQHQHAEPPVEKLRNVPTPLIALLQVLLAKDPNRRFQTAAQLQQAVARVREAIASGSGLTMDGLRSARELVALISPKGKPKKRPIRWVVGSGLCVSAVAITWFFFFGHAGFVSTQRITEAAPIEKSVAVLPFESLSESKSDSYFADGVQDEILNNLAKIAQLKVISRTSVMQYRADTKRDLRQIANALGVANVLEGTVRRDGNHVRVSTELVDASNDHTIWADSYDRDLTDIFAIQSEVAQTIANKLTATLSPEEKKNIEAKPTDNLEAYDLYLQAKGLIDHAIINPTPTGNNQKPLLDGIDLLERAVGLDPKFTLAYCASAKAHDFLYNGYDMTLTRRALGDAAVQHALRLQPDLAEVHLANAFHLYVTYRDYERARVQLDIAKRGLPNSSEAPLLEAYMDRRQGSYEKAVNEFNEAIIRDPRNLRAITELANTLFFMRQFKASERVYDRAIDLASDLPVLQVLKATNAVMKSGDETGLRSALAALPASMAKDRGALTWRLTSTLLSRDWQQAKELVETMQGGEDDGGWFFANVPVPVGCYSILLARFQGEQPKADSGFGSTREQLNQMVQKSPGDARQLSNLAMLDALLGKKHDAIAEAKHAVEMLPISKDAVDGPIVLSTLAQVYAWTDEPDLAFEEAEIAAKIPNGLFYGDLKLDPYWDPLRKDPRFEKLLAELAPRD